MHCVLYDDGGESGADGKQWYDLSSKKIRKVVPVADVSGGRGGRKKRRGKKGVEGEKSMTAPDGSKTGDGGVGRKVNSAMGSAVVK